MTTLISISFCGCCEKYVPDTSRHKLSHCVMLQEKVKHPVLHYAPCGKGTNLETQ